MTNQVRINGKVYKYQRITRDIMQPYKSDTVRSWEPNPDKWEDWGLEGWDNYRKNDPNCLDIGTHDWNDFPLEYTNGSGAIQTLHEGDVLLFSENNLMSHLTESEFNDKAEALATVQK